MTVGDKIKFLRKSKGLTQTELGEIVGVKKNAVSKWECGRVEDIPTSTIKALATIFEVKPSYLIDDKENQPTEHLTGETDNPNIKKDTTLSGDVDAELKCIWNNIDDADREFLLANARMLMERRNKK